MSDRKHNRLKRLTAFVLAAVMLTALLPPITLRVRAASFADPYMEKLYKMGILRGGDDGLQPEAPCTRAMFVSMVNRAYGYNEVGPVPFSDINPYDRAQWYADDIAIAYNAGYFSGIPGNLADPHGVLTREQVLVMLARNMRMEPVTGETTYFDDSRSFSAWSRGYVEPAVKAGLIEGYSDKTYRPLNNVSRGEVAIMLCRAVGELIQDEGVTPSLDLVTGNLTISASNSTLKDTTVTGNLYISGGLGLGSVMLDNVEVLGDIVLAGGGESETGNDSIVLKNTRASRLVVDNLKGQYMSVRTEGDTSIKNTVIRTESFIQDRAPSGQGLKNIVLDGDQGARFTLSGNLEDILNVTPAARLLVSAGTVQSLTMDETAAGSTLTLDFNTSVNKVNLDTGIAILGNGDIDNLTVNTAGTTTTMLPDQVTVRPGISASIGGSTMDTKLAQESSSTPRMLAGYPAVRDMAPTSASIAFSTNKSGTIYWAISATTDGSISEDALINAESGTTAASKQGSLKIAASETEHIVKVTGLTAGGNYYLSAVMVDARGVHSAVKVVSFSTPDKTAPGFASGYPEISLFTETSAQAAVMTTKSCYIYYALFPKGSSAPTADDFRAGALDGNYGNGKVYATRNTPEYFYVNNRVLKEQDTYDLYMMLSDADNGKNSAIKKLTFKMPDRTPPVFLTEPIISGVKATSISFTATMDEACTIYWVAVLAGAKYPKPSEDTDGDTEPLNTQYAKTQVMAGLNCVKSGKVNAKANAETAFTASSLQAQTSYDIYYIAKDTSGNSSSEVAKVTASTEDKQPPTASQSFNRYEGTNKEEPYANTDITVTFSENVLQASTNKRLIELYDAIAIARAAGSEVGIEAAKNELAKALRKTILLYNDTGSGNPQIVPERTFDDQTEEWAIDYRNAVLSYVDAQLNVTFRSIISEDDPKDMLPALSLNSGSTYYFQIEDIADTSSAKNLMGITKLPRFTTISSLVAIKDVNETDLNVYEAGQVVGDTTLTEEKAMELNTIDVAFSLTPISTGKSDDGVSHDIILWSDTSIDFDVYRRTIKGDSVSTWEKLPYSGKTVLDASYEDDYMGQSFYYNRLGLEPTNPFPELKTLDENTIYQYAVHITKLEENPARATWSKSVNFHVSVVSGSHNGLLSLATDITEKKFDELTAKDAALNDISSPNNYTITAPFTDTVPPEFMPGFPTFETGDSSVQMTVLLNRPGTVYYVVAPAGDVVTQQGGEDVSFENALIPTMIQVEGAQTGGKEELSPKELFKVSQPTPSNIHTPTFRGNDSIKSGNVEVGSGAVPIIVTDLLADTPYFAYFVIKGTGPIYSDQVMLYKFRTDKVSRPVITLDLSNPTVYVTSDRNAIVDYLVVSYNSSQLSDLLTKPFNSSDVIRQDLTDGEKADLEQYSNLTVLQAMGTSAIVGEGEASQGTVFDKYASNNYKNQLADYIRGTSVDTAGRVIGVGHDVKVNVGKRVEVDCGSLPMSERAQYAFLAVGRSTLGSSDAFRAIYPLTKVDKEPPIVTAIQSVLTMDPDIVDGPNVIKSNTCSGMISLTFSENLYYLDESMSPPTLYGIDLGPMQRDSNTYKGFMAANSRPFIQSSFAGSSAGSKITPRDDGSPGAHTLVLDINVEKVPNGSFITFGGNLCDQFQNVRGVALTVSVNFTTMGDQTIPSVSITPEWDGRQPQQGGK